MQVETVIPDKPLLRKRQIDDMVADREALTRQLNNGQIQEKGQITRQLQNLARQLKEQTPTPFPNKELDHWVKEERRLRDEMLQGMPSQEEMRKAPAGAVGKHQIWEKLNKAKLNKWKNIRLKLNPDSDDPDIANIERYRPTRSTLNMDNPVVPGKMYHMPETSGPAVVFSNEQIALLKTLSPELATQLATLSNAQRSEIKGILNQPSGVENQRAVDTGDSDLDGLLD